MIAQTNNNRDFDENSEAKPNQHHTSNDASSDAKRSSVVDSDVNTSQPTSKNGASLTNDEDANADPNKVSDKPSFKK